MASVRVLFALLVAVAAASAFRHPQVHPAHPAHQTHHRDLPLRNTAYALTAEFSNHETFSTTADAVEKAIAKLKDLVKKIQEKAKDAEEEVIDALDGYSRKIVDRANAALKRITGVDFELDDKWAGFEKKAARCSAHLQNQVTDILRNIKAQTENCAATEITEVEILGSELIQVAEILETVPVQTIAAVKACGKEEDKNDDDKPKPEGRDLPDMMNKAKCVSAALMRGAHQLESLPKLVIDISNAARHLVNKTTVKFVQQCAADAVRGRERELRKHAAELAYCVIAPEEDESSQSDEPAQPAKPDETEPSKPEEPAKPDETEPAKPEEPAQQ